MSSNTKRLHEACKAVNVNSYHIEAKEELAGKWFKDVESVGITAGASTPQWIIDQIKETIEQRASVS